MSGQFADGWKCALVNPLLKKRGLDLLCKNYRPISSLQYVFKVGGKGFIQTDSWTPALQSSYRTGHSTETALLKVMNDIMLAMDSKCVTLLVLLDMTV